MATFSVSILTQDVTDDIEAVRDLNSSVDYPEVSQYRIGECTLILLDPDGKFSFRNPDNFFVQNGLMPTGEGASVTVDIDGERQFVGEVIDVVIDSVEGVTQILCSNGSWKLGRDQLTDFGLQKRFRIDEAVDDVLRRAVARGEPQGHGNYPVLPAALPASPESQSGLASLSEQMLPVDNLRSYGLLDSKRFIIDNQGVKTEGGPLTQTGSFPQVQFKTPFRWLTIGAIVSEILSHFDVANSQIIVFPDTIDPHFTTRGRVGYDTIGIDQFDLPLRWQNFVTSTLVYQDDTYFLMSIPRNDGFYRSQIIKYDINDAEYSIVHQFPTGLEAWQMANNDNDFYVMLCGSGSPYNNRHTGADTHIRKVDIDSETETTVVPAVSQDQASLFQTYHIAGGQLPYHADSRGGFAYHNGFLYYRFVKDTTCGIARLNVANGTTARIMTYEWDGHENDGGLAFHINTTTSVLLGAVTFRDGTDSILKAFSVTLS